MRRTRQGENGCDKRVWQVRRTLDLDRYENFMIAASTQSMIQRARQLATGLADFHPPPDLPLPLWESAYLLQESRQPQRPLLERLRILGLMAASSDQFFIEKLPRWQHWAESQPTYVDWLSRLPTFLEPLLQQAVTTFQTELLPRLEITLAQPADLPPPALHWLRTFFSERIYPLLTPLAIDSSHPFPFISSFSHNFIVHLAQTPPRHDFWRGLTYARLKVPRLLPRYMAIPREISADEANAARPIYVQSEEIVRYFLPDLFPGVPIATPYLFRVVRAAEYRSRREPLDPSPSRQRQMALPVVRLDVERSMPDTLVAWLADHLEAPLYTCYRTTDPVGQLHLVELANLLEGHTPAHTALF